VGNCVGCPSPPTIKMAVGGDGGRGSITPPLLTRRHHGQHDMTRIVLLPSLKPSTQVLHCTAASSLMLTLSHPEMAKRVCYLLHRLTNHLLQPGCPQSVPG
jgi:hypothetical protein